MRDVHWTYCGDHLATYTNTELLHCTSETIIMLCPLYLNFLFKKKNKEVRDWDLELFKWREVTNLVLVDPVASNSLFCLVF